MLTVAAACRAVLVVTFLVSAGAKAFGYGPWRAAVREFGVPAPLAPFVAVAVPALEALVAVLLLGGEASVRTGGAIGTVLLLAFTAGIAANLLAGRRPTCNCFGQLSAKPLGWPSVARNAVLTVLAVTVAVVRDVGTDAGTWLGDRTTTEVVLGAALAVLGLAVAALARLLFTLIGRYGAVLIRVEQLEEDLAAVTGPRPAPAFALAGTDGVTHSLGSALPDHGYLVLVFGSADCKPCGELAPRLPAWQREHAGALRFAVVATGDADAAAAKFAAAADAGIPLLLDPGGQVTAAYGVDGTPAAVAVSPSGFVFGGPAYAPDGVAELVAAAAEAVESHDSRQVLTIEPPPLRPGDPMPDVVVLDAHAHELPLRVESESVVLFWDTRCGFAAQIRDEVAAWEGSADLVVVTRDTPGTPLGFGDRTLYDPPLAACGAFGAPGTPSAVAVDEKGRLVSPVAVGGDAVLELLGMITSKDSRNLPISTTVPSTSTPPLTEEAL